MKKTYGLYLLTNAVVVFVSYFLGASIYASGHVGSVSIFLMKAWIMAVVAILLAASGIYVFIQAKSSTQRTTC